MEIEMEIIRIDSGENVATNILNSSEKAQNPSNANGSSDRKEENFGIASLPVGLFDEDRRFKKEDFKYNFLALKWASWIKMSPFGFGFGVDENSKNFPRFRASHKKWWGNGISSGWFLVASIRVFIMIWSTAHFMVNQNPEENLGQMTLTSCLTICATLLIYTISSYISKAQNMAPFLFSIFKYLDADAETDAELQQKKSQQRKFGLGFGFGRHTLKELLIIHLPFLVYAGSGMIPLLSAVDSSFPFLLVSLVQPEISFSFLSLAAIDSVIALYYFMIVHMIFYVFMGMHRIQEETRLTIKNLTKTKKTTSSQTTTPTEYENYNEKSMKIQKALKNIRLLHNWTRFFNASFSNVIYIIKLVSLTGSIFGGFGCIKMIEVENVPYVGIFLLLFLDGLVFYNLLFGRAFEIPEKVEELKREIRKQSFKTYKNDPVQRKYVEKYLRSIPWLGVKDGVYKMERLTCVNFICFVVQQITSLVLAY